MALVRWDPWQDMLSAQRDFQRLFSRLVGDAAAQSGANGASSGAFVPPTEVFTRGGDLVVRAELPGIDPEKDVNVSLSENILTLTGERRQEREENEGSLLRQETSYGSFHRQFVLPEHVKAEDIQASYKDGILEVIVPKAAVQPEPARIPIQSGEGRRKAITTEGSKA
jgi:HSP20 family protein